jgi:hypothetical protein
LLLLALLQAVEAGCVPQLLGLLQGSDSQVAGAAAAALMMLTLAKEAKVAVHQVRQLCASGGGHLQQWPAASRRSVIP